MTSPGFEDTNDLTRGLVAGWMIDQIGRGRSTVRIVSCVAVVVGFVFMLGAGGFARGLGITVIMLGLIVLMAQLLARRVARLSAERFASPVSLAGKREQIDAVAADVGMPTSSLGIIRFVSNARRPKGVTEMDAMTVRLERDVIDGAIVRDVPSVGRSLGPADVSHPELEGPEDA